MYMCILSVCDYVYIFVIAYVHVCTCMFYMCTRVHVCMHMHVACVLAGRCFSKRVGFLRGKEGGVPSRSENEKRVVRWAPGRGCETRERDKLPTDRLTTVSSMAAFALPGCRCSRSMECQPYEPSITKAAPVRRYGWKPT